MLKMIADDEDRLRAGIDDTLEILVEQILEGQNSPCSGAFFSAYGAQ